MTTRCASFERILNEQMHKSCIFPNQHWATGLYNMVLAMSVVVPPCASFRRTSEDMLAFKIEAFDFEVVTTTAQPLVPFCRMNLSRLLP